VFIFEVEPRFRGLFGTSQWPDDLAQRYYTSRASLSREVPAVIGAEAIDRFLAADGDKSAFQASQPGDTPKLVPAFFPSRKMAVVKVVTTVSSMLFGFGVVTLLEHLMR
jgi:hypothetical protein